jgi:hypothetical protein
MDSLLSFIQNEILDEEEFVFLEGALIHGMRAMKLVLN